MIIDKNCDHCNVELKNVNHQTRYCSTCKKISDKKSAKKYSDRNSVINSQSKEDKLVANFNNVVKVPYQLTPLGFNSVSELSYNAYQNFYRKTWVEIIKSFDKYNDLLKYIVDEYQKYINETGKQAFRSFTDSHVYIGQQMLKSIGFDNIREMLNLKKYRNNENKCMIEFNRLVNSYGRIPLYSEFLEDSRISLKSFQYHLNIIENKNIYDKIVEFFTDECEYNVYLDNKSKHKTQTGIDNHQGNRYTEKDLELNLKSIFNRYFKECDSYPSLHLFDKVSDISVSTYTNRLNKKWKEICSDYGYNIEGKINKSEKIALGIVSEILNEEYEPQKTFDWLIGFKNFPLFCDGYFPNHKLVVEFDGDQHRYPIEWFGGMKVFNDTKTNDKYKDVFIPRNGLTLIRISSEEPFWDKEYIRNKLIKSNISNILDSAI